jgi:hypothetical protein
MTTRETFENKTKEKTIYKEYIERANITFYNPDYVEYLESLVEQMLEALKEVKQSALQDDCKECPNDKRDEDNCRGCVMYVDNLILQIEGKELEGKE